MTTKTTDTDTMSQLAYIDLDSIAVSKTNQMFRDPADFQPEALSDLAASIRDKGVIQPVLLRPDPSDPDKFLLVAGERRFHASKLVRGAFKDRTTIPAFIKEMTEAEALELQIVENLQRENINPIREARGFAFLVKEKKLTTAAIAAKLGKSMDYVQERLRLMDLIPELQELVRGGDLPLKAGLKYAMIPKEDQEDAMENTVEEINLGEKKSKVIFAGLDKLQEWMDNHLFIDLKTADFDKEDPKLNPAMGPCSTCVFRTKNTGGLFDDITLVDECTKAACFRTKQINHYNNLKEQLKKKFPAAKIIFKKRSNSIEGTEVYRKGLVGEIKGSGAGTVCSEQEAQKKKGSELAILIGVPRSRYTEFPATKPFVWIKPSEMSRAAANNGKADKGKAISPEVAERNAKKEEEKQLKEQVADGFEMTLISEKILEYQHNDKIYAQILRQILDYELDYSDNVPMLPALKALGIDWYMKGKLVKAKEFDLLAFWQSKEFRATVLDSRDLERTLQGVDLNDLVALLFVAKYHGDDSAKKLFNVKEQEIKKKANSQMQSWWDKRAAAEKEKSMKATGARLDVYKQMDAGLSVKEAAKKLEDLGNPAAAGKKKGGSKK